MLACPLTQGAIGSRYDRLADPSITLPGWVPLVIHGLFAAHLVVSIVAAVAVVRVFRRWWSRLLAWILVESLLPMSFYAWLGILMMISGSVL